MVPKFKLNAAPTLYIIIAISLLTVPIKWAAAWFLAVVLHESAHYVALRSIGCSVYRVVLGAAGAEMNTDHLEGWREAICSAAGPVISISLGLLASVFPRLALCGFVQGIFNLLPIYPMDGGRILNGIFGRCRFGKVITKLAEWVSIIAIGAIAFYGWLNLALGPLPLILFVVILLRARKIPCKAGEFAVQ